LPVSHIVQLAPDKGALRLTTALYHTPSGRAVQRTGVEPDIELAPAAARREGSRERSLPGADEPAPPKARVEPARCAPAGAQDPVLGCALAYLRAGTLERFVAALGPAETMP
jgi:carboxyl-terminal processing protease